MYESMNHKVYIYSSDKMMAEEAETLARLKDPEPDPGKSRVILDNEDTINYAQKLWLEHRAGVRAREGNYQQLHEVLCDAETGKVYEGVVLKSDVILNSSPNYPDLRIIGEATEKYLVPFENKVGRHPLDVISSLFSLRDFSQEQKANVTKAYQEYYAARDRVVAKGSFYVEGHQTRGRN